MRFRSLILPVVLLALITGCAGTPQVPIAMTTGALSDNSSRVGLLFQSQEESKLALPGAACLLCLAVAASANSALSKHVKTLSLEDITKLESDITATLTAQGNEVVSIDSAMKLTDLPKSSSKEENAAKRKFGGLAERYNVDKILVVSLTHVGATRNYANYVPKGAPFAAINGESYLVDPATNSYLWFLPIAYSQIAEGEWKEPPGYPGLTNAYYRVVEQFRDDILGPISADANSASGVNDALEAETQEVEAAVEETVEELIETSETQN